MLILRWTILLTAGPLQTQAQIGLDITAVTQTQGIAPGSDLTVTIRL